VFRPVPDSTLYTGISLRELINKFKQRTLQLFKLMLLQKRVCQDDIVPLLDLTMFQVLFFGQKVEHLSSYQYGLVSLIPDLLRSLQDVGSPAMSYQQSSRTTTKELVSEILEGSKSKYQKLALPLKIFGEVLHSHGNTRC
jgi:hypothetical protein